MASLASLSDFGKKYTQLCSHPNYDDIHPEWRKCVDRITMDDNITYAFKVFIYETLLKTLPEADTSKTDVAASSDSKKQKKKQKNN